MTRGEAGLEAVGDEDAIRVSEIVEGAVCACCAGHHHQPAEGEASPSSTRRDSLDWDEAAEQIGRANRTWSDKGSATPGFSFGGPAMGEAAQVTYGFLRNADVSDDSGQTYRAMNAAEIAMTEYAMALISEVANIEFVRVQGRGGYLDDPSDAQIDLDAIANSNGGLARTSWSGSTYREATVSIGEDGLEELGAYAFRTAIHEVAHAVGLSHPSAYGERPRYDTDAEYREDSAQYTVMSYFDETATGADFGRSYSTNLMLHDVAALQRLYGVNDQTRTGDTVYGFGSNTNDAGWTADGADHDMIGAIWDAGGHDRLDLSGYAQDQRIDLREEAFSDAGGLTANIAIARGAVIEEAIGGAGDDVLVGNDASNLLVGGAGDDVLYGDGGAMDGFA